MTPKGVPTLTLFVCRGLRTKSPTNGTASATGGGGAAMVVWGVLQRGVGICATGTLRFTLNVVLTLLSLCNKLPGAPASWTLIDQ